jgi:hypothetical protein
MSLGFRRTVAIICWVLAFATAGCWLVSRFQAGFGRPLLSDRAAVLCLACFPLLITVSTAATVGRRPRACLLWAPPQKQVLDVVDDAFSQVSSRIQTKDVVHRLLEQLALDLGLGAVGVWQWDPNTEKLKLLDAVNTSGRRLNGNHVLSVPKDDWSYLGDLIYGRKESAALQTRRRTGLGECRTRIGQGSVHLAAAMRWNGKTYGLVSADATPTGVEATAFQMKILRVCASVIAAVLGYESLHMHLQEREKQYQQVLDGLFKAGQAVMSGRDLFDVGKDLILQVRKTLGVDRASLWILDPEKNELRGLVGVVKDGPIRDERGWGVPMSRTDHPMVAALLSGELSNREEGYTNVIAPMMIGGEKIGVLAVDNMTSREPLRPEALQALKVFAEHAALAVRNSQLIQSREKEAQLRGVTLTAITVAHQINNALVGVVSGAELLERGAAQLDPKQAKLVRNIAQSGRQIAEFVKKLSNVTRLTTVKYLGNLEMLDLGSASNGEDGGASTTQPEEKGNGNANQQNKEL